jgi:hypothetical protein
MEELCSPCKDFNEISYLNIIRKSVEKIQVSLKSDKNNLIYMKTYINICYLFSQFFLVCEIFQKKKVVQKLEIQIFKFHKFCFFRKLFRIGDNMVKHSRIRHATGDDIMERNLSACCIDKAKETLSEYVIIIDFLWQQRIRERVSE